MPRDKRRAHSVAQRPRDESASHFTSAGEKVALRSAPVYHPTDAEFANPLAYIAAIRDEVQRYGIATIVPPRSWHPRFSLRKDTLKFRMQIQHLAELQRRLHNADSAAAFQEDYDAFLERNDGGRGRGAQVGVPNKPPTVGGAVVNLARLFRIVTELGGAQRVSETRKWKDVARLMMVGQHMNNAAYSLRLVYGKYLGKYEVYRNDQVRSCARAHNQGAPSTAAAATAPAGPGFGALAASPPGSPIRGSRGGAVPGTPRKIGPDVDEIDATRPLPRKVFPAFGEGDSACAECVSGLLALERSSHAPPNSNKNIEESINNDHNQISSVEGNQERRKRAKAADGSAWSTIMPRSTNHNNNVADEPRHLGDDSTDEMRDAVAYLAEGAQQRHSHANEEDDDGDGGDGGGCTGHLHNADDDQMTDSQTTPPLTDPNDAEMSPGAESGESPQLAWDASIRLDQICPLCHGGHHEDKMVLCDRCDDGYHTFCLSPPLEDIPEGDWICPRCAALGDNSATPPLEDGGEMDFLTFRQLADGFMNERLGGESRALGAAWQELEAEFWRIVESAVEPVEVMAAVNLDSAKHGSGFPRRRAQREVMQDGEGSSRGVVVTDEDGVIDDDRRRRGSGLGLSVPMHGDCVDVEESAWNLNNVAHLGGTCPSLLRCLEGRAPGKVTPTLSLGMLFSSTQWKIEEHNLYSITYHHWGHDKIWYSVPNDAVGDFLDSARRADSFNTSVPLSGVDMIHPRTLVADGVPVFRAVQRPRQFVVVFPGAVTARVDMGMNCMESVAAAPIDWLPLSSEASAWYRENRLAQSLCHEELVLEEAVGIDVGKEELRDTPPENLTDGGELLCEEREELLACGGPNVPAAAARRTRNLEPGVACWLAPELAKVAEEERALRESVFVSGTVKSAPLGRCGGRGSDPECSICRQRLHLSALECSCTPGRLTCLRHADQLCECAPSKRTLLWRYSLEAIDAATSEATRCASAGLPAGAVLGSTTARRCQPCSVKAQASQKSVPAVSAVRRKEASEWEAKARAALSGQWTAFGLPGAERMTPLKTVKLPPAVDTDGKHRVGGGRIRKEKRRYDPADMASPPSSAPVDVEKQPGFASTQEALADLMEERQRLCWGGAETRASRDLASALRALCKHAEEVGSTTSGNATVSQAERLVAAERKPISPAFLAGRGPNPMALPPIPETKVLADVLPRCQTVARKFHDLKLRGQNQNLLERPDPSEYHNLARQCDALPLRLDDESTLRARAVECNDWSAEVARLFPGVSRAVAPGSIDDNGDAMHTEWLAQAPEPEAEAEASIAPVGASRSKKKGGNKARARESRVSAADNGVLGAVDLGIEQDANSLPSIEDGRALLNRGLSLGAALVDLPTLRDAVEACDAFLRKASAVLDANEASRASPVAFESLASEAATLRLRTREVASTVHSIDALVRWKASFRATLLDFSVAGRGARGRSVGSGGGTANAAAVCASKAETLIAGAQSLPVRLRPECELLSSIQDLATWSLDAERALTNKPAQAMEDIAKARDAGTELLDKFENALMAAAVTWHAPKMAGANAPEPPEGPPPAMSELLENVEARCDFATKWEVRSAEILACAGRGNQVPLDELMAHHREGSTSGVALPSLREITAVVDVAKVWLDGVMDCLRERTSRRQTDRGNIKLPTFAKVEELLAQVPSLVGVADREVELLHEKHEMASSWRKETSAFLATPPPVAMEEFERLLDEAHRISIQMDEIRRLQMRRDGVAWMSKAGAMLGKAKPLEEEPSHGNDISMACAEAAVVDAHAAAAEKDARPTLEEVKLLIDNQPKEQWSEHAVELSGVHEQLIRLGKLAEVGDAWAIRARSALESHAPIEVYRDLLVEARRLPCTVSNDILALEQAVDASEAWNEAVHESLGDWLSRLNDEGRLLVSPSLSSSQITPPKQEVVMRHLIAASELRCSLPSLTKVRKAMSLVEDWRRNAAIRLVHSPDEEKLVAILEIAQASLSEALLNTDPGGRDAEHVQRIIRQQMEEHGVDDEHAGVYCICRRFYNGGTMLGCDLCGDWYHVDCLGLNAKAVRTIGDGVYVCPLCTAASIDPTGFDVCKQLSQRRFPAYHVDDEFITEEDKGKKTKKKKSELSDGGDGPAAAATNGDTSLYPSMPLVRAVLQESTMLPCEPDESAILGEILAKVEAFDARVAAVLDGDNSAAAAATAGEGADTCPVIQVLLKNALAIKLGNLQCIPALVNHLSDTAFERYLETVGVNEVLERKLGLSKEWGAKRVRS
ncbi:lysine-specific demethylase [Pycnococcus provasolii]